MKCNPGLRILLALVLWIPVPGAAMQPDTTWNQTDAMGRKQGYWKRLSESGSLIYRGTFKDDRPVGPMQRYYENGSKQADLIYIEGSNTVYAVLYDLNGELTAKGKYVDTQKDSIWTYFSNFGSLPVYTETYLNGKKHGKSLKFYPEGSVAEVLYWKEDLKDGLWQQFYEDSTLRLSSSFLRGQLQGDYTVYNRDGISRIQGTFLNGKMDGTWTFSDNDGAPVNHLEYDNGRLLNEEVVEEWVQNYMDEVEKKLGTIPEVDYENFFER